MAIRLVTFDALHTIMTPRLPIYVQYSQTFEPNLGVLDPDALRQAFKAGTYIVMFAVPFVLAELKSSSMERVAATRASLSDRPSESRSRQRI